MERNKFYYNEIKNYLLELIEKNSDKPDYMLPSENQLAKKFNTSRLTVKNAMNILVNTGLVVRYQGKGTFINTNHFKNEKAEDITVCIITPNITSRFVQEIISGASDYFGKNKTNCFLYRTGNSQHYEQEILGKLPKHRIDGILIYPASGDIYNKSLLRLALENYPTVSVDRNLHDLDIDCVLTDHYKMLYDCTSKLIKEGHKNIAFIHPESRAQSTQNRIAGYQAALIDAEITPQNKHKLLLPYDYFAVYDPVANEKMHATFNAFLKENPEITAVISSNNFGALPLIESLRSYGKNIDLTFIDDDYPELKNYFSYPYRAIIQDGYRIGQTAAKILLEKIANPTQTTRIVHIPMLTDSPAE